MRTCNIILKLLAHHHHPFQMLNLQHHIIPSRPSSLKLRQCYRGLNSVADFSAVPFHGNDIGIGDGVDDSCGVDGNVPFIVEPAEVFLPDLFAVFVGKGFVV